ncbi:hypothetical protein C6P42_003060 [Pichia californica]|nr:hypothetical protein C6P42_003060 [[Candida] californica]
MKEYTVLKYCDSLELYNTSTVVFLGNIPPAWILDKKSILFAKFHRLDSINSIQKQHPEHTTLKKFETQSKFANTEFSNVISSSDIDNQHNSLKNKFISKFLHSPNIHLKTNDSSPYDITINSLLKSKSNPSTYLVNVEGNDHHPNDNSKHNKSLHSNFVNTIFNSVHFNIPRESHQDKNMQFHLFMNNNLDSESEISNESYESSENDNDSADNLDDNIDNNSLTPSFNPIPILNNNDQQSILSPNQSFLKQNSTSTITNGNNTIINENNPKLSSQMPESLRIFFEKPNDIKQEILKDEIDNAMISLQKNYTEINDRSDTDTDNDSFTTASEIPLDSIINNSNNKINNSINKQDSSIREHKSVSFDTLPLQSPFKKIPRSVKMNNATSMYTLQSKRLLLDKQTPFPYSNEKGDENNKEENLFINENKTTHPNITEAYTTIDDDVAETYKILKTKTLGAKLGLSGEIDKFEHKRKMKKLLQNFQAGEIIKMEKMLVMVSTIEKFKLNSESKKSSRILERWREYITVVRATNDFDYPAIIQFFKSNKIFRNDDSSKLKKEIYEEVLDKQRKEDEEEEKEEEEEEEDDDDEPKKYVSDEEKEGSSKFGGNTIDEELDHFDEKNRTLMDENKNSTLRSTIAKFKNNKDEKDFIRKKNIEKSNPNRENKSYKKDKNCHFSFVLSRRDVNVNFANLLDKSIRITKEKRSCTLMYTLLAHSTSSAIVWLSFLRQLLNSNHQKDGSNALLVSIPSLDISFTITGVKTFYKTYIAEHAMMSDYINIKYSENGYIYPHIKSFNSILDLIEKKVTDLEKYGKLPNNAMAKEFLTRIKTDRSFLALSFRKYDRLEWILGESESLIQILWNIYASSYELELREFQHESHILSDMSQIEPLPIEGFVTKLSNRRGKLTSKIGRQYYKILYAFTVENLLFFQDFFDAVPILPNCEKSQRHLISPAGDILDLKELEKAATFDPIVYQNTPYPRTAHHIKWLKPGISLEEYADKDANALYEAERRACMISNASEIVDLCKITDIKLVPKEDISLIVRAACHVTWKHSNGDEKETISNEHKNSLFKTLSRKGLIEDDEYIENCFELVMDNGSILRIQVSTKTIRNEWAKNLSKLSEYWTLKKKEDLIRHVVLKEKNLKLMNDKNDDCYESLIANENGTSCPKWELSKAYTDTQLYSISSYVLDKPVLMEGYLYCKKFKSRQFKMFYAVMSPGFFVVYDIFQRSKGKGIARNSAYYRRFASISLASCYVFANTSKSNTDTKDQAFFSLSSGEDGLPRVYGDGWRSSESIYERSFTLWFGSKKIMMKNMKEKKGLRLNNDEGKNSMSSESKKSFMINDNDKSSNLSISSKGKTRNKILDKFGKGKLKKKHESLGKSLNREIVSDSSEEISDEDEDNEEKSQFPFQYESESEFESDSENSSIDNEIARDVFNVGKNDEAEKVSKREWIKSASKLGITGRAIKFLARSRVDRDLWVTRLMTEIDRFSINRDSDIKLI